MTKSPRFLELQYRRYSTRKKQEEKLFGGPITLRVSEQRRNELQEQIMDWRENRRKVCHERIVPFVSEFSRSITRIETTGVFDPMIGRHDCPFFVLH